MILRSKTKFINLLLFVALKLLLFSDIRASVLNDISYNINSSILQTRLVFSIHFEVYSLG